jgi:hypothetical protein
MNDETVSLLLFITAAKSLESHLVKSTDAVASVLGFTA